MAKSKNVVFSGKAHWARVYEGNHDEFNGKEFYKITVELDDESWSKFNQSGLSLKPKPVASDSEELGVTFKRDLEAKTGIDAKGKKWTLGGGPPRVKDADGEVINDLIGNGSTVEVLINVYTVGAGPMKGKKGHRLEAVKVLNLIKYEPPGDDDDEAEVEEETPVEEPKKSTSKSKGMPF